MGRYIFREIKREELPRLFRLIEDRIRWMDEVGIRQWNVTCYTEVYPMSYYEEKHEKGEVFVLEDTELYEIVCGAVLKSEDARWADSNRNDGEPSFYVHNFASKIGSGGAGKIFLYMAEDYARSVGKKYMRLDSASDNEKLTAFYDSLGYTPAGHCVDGLYCGILRQKLL